MKIDYKGHRIEVTRDKCLAGYELLYYTIMRLSDYHFIADSFSEQDVTVREFAEQLKVRVDAEDKDEQEFQAWFTTFCEHFACHTMRTVEEAKEAMRNCMDALREQWERGEDAEDAAWEEWDAGCDREETNP